MILVVVSLLVTGGMAPVVESEVSDSLRDSGLSVRLRATCPFRLFPSSDIVFLSAVGVLFGTMGSPVFERAIRGSRGLMYESSFRIPGNELRMTNTELRTGSGTEKRGDGKGVGRERRVNKAAPITIETTEKKYLFPREYIGIL